MSDYCQVRDWKRAGAPRGGLPQEEPQRQEPHPGHQGVLLLHGARRKGECHFMTKLEQ